ncbi:dipeptide epimerase [Oceanotoga sp. DSM 15011]|jgi:o-succinylbenzoate synthase|uniref:Dipeptide epimerase n=1 Tax=Oceanotoga teriensis TaxID=515440 RepID=A0AA45HIE4_9BACT|nr:MULTISPECIES: dipeptide epimerase [Oceanotoga]MDO7976006.1 dipeptide epimerase [Oceanotoga teriensis]PWJ92046.1 o-succinylbenzoate synthase [Oceanotoga teriensis]UYO98999.1 dipeptide epimerase [Oceanotoga sp. DSM 15011]
MKITDIKTEKLNVELKEPFITSAGPLYAIENVLITIETDSGIKGYGESAFEYRVTGEIQESIIAAIQKFIKPCLIGENPLNTEIIHEKINKAIHNNYSAKAGVEIAIYDIIGKTYNIPLYTLFGGYSNNYQTDITISLNDPKTMLESASKYVKEGFDTLKIKVGNELSEDIKRIKTIRDNLPEKIKIRIDANQGWTPKEAIYALNRLKKYEIEFVEQPVHEKDIRGMAFVRNNTEIPVMADESVYTPQDVIEIIKLEAADLINIKLMKSGGIYNALDIAKISQAAGMKCMIGCMIESNISITAAAHLATGCKNIKYIDLDSDLFLKHNFSKGVKTAAGNITISDKPGLGIEI